ncbi:sigma-54-dependent Fis family transcriptional regulator [Zhaonella formicivorans]|uniref:sigma-54-dependent Fis family transcriptional regulator n=1 Tax=Zhaonella formicivorans TaxID=2528593 RepID=UPI0010EB61DB|nr:sigma-54-dependent Fis family transcriptional regulator [Zhaonella formicivorans]
MKKQEIVFIAPYDKLAGLVEEVCLEIKLPVRVLVGNLEEGVRVARQVVGEGAEVIISRGGTASLIMQAVDVPVVEVHVTSFDILNCFSQLQNLTGTIGLVGFGNVVYGCENIGRIFGLKLKQLTIGCIDEAEAKVAEAAQAGIRHIIGDTIAVNKARELGLNGYLVESGKEAIAKAVFEAQRVALVRRQEREKAERIKIILDSINDGLIAIDEQERITMINPAAERIFGLRTDQVIGKQVKDVIPNTKLPEILKSGEAEVGEIQDIGSTRIATSRIPIMVKNEVVGAIATFQDITELQHYEQIIRSKLHKKGLVARTKLEQIITASPLMQDTLAKARKFAAVESTVLITGESGTGKELIAQGIHNASQRKNGPFVAVNCAAMPENLLESELFGYEEGAFTGARKGGKQGLFELAHKGTLFLDEIGEMPLALQSRLLRVLQEKEVMRLGADYLIPVDVRVVAATNRDLYESVAEGNFRQDLFYRLNILNLQLPSLRERKGDIPVLAKYFLNKFQHLNPLVTGFAPEALEVLSNYAYPGNVRELENMVEKLVILSAEEIISAAAVENVLAEIPWRSSRISGQIMLEGTLQEIESRIILQVWEEEHHNQSAAARRLGIDRSTLWRKLQQLGVA